LVLRQGADDRARSGGGSPTARGRPRRHRTLPEHLERLARLKRRSEYRSAQFNAVHFLCGTGGASAGLGSVSRQSIGDSSAVRRLVGGHGVLELGAWCHALRSELQAVTEL